MKIIHHAQRRQSTCWLCTGGSASVLGWSPPHRDSASTAVTHRMCAQPRGAPHLSELARCPQAAAGTARPFPCGWMGCFSPLLWRQHRAPAGRRREGEDLSRRSSPRALGTSNPALLHFRPPRSTEELSNDRLSSSEQALAGMQRCPPLLTTP